MEQDSFRDQSQQSSSIDANQSDLSVPTIRASARVRAAKQREQQSEPSTSTQATRSSINLRSRIISSAPTRGKQKESNRWITFYCIIPSFMLTIGSRFA